MYELGNNLAPVLQLGEEFAEHKPLPSSSSTASAGKPMSEGASGEGVKEEGSGVTDESGGERNDSLVVSKTTGVL